MHVVTKVFGDIDISDDKVVTLDKGIIGFPDLKSFAIIYDESKVDSGVSWFQSLDEPAFAMPVVDPLVVIGRYDPAVAEKDIAALNITSEDDILVLVTMTIPKDRIEDMTVNLKAPIIINSVNRKGCQVILDDSSYEIKHRIYESLKNARS